MNACFLVTVIHKFFLRNFFNRIIIIIVTGNDNMKYNLVNNYCSLYRK